MVASHNHKIHTQFLANKIAKLVRQRMSQEKVVFLSEIRQVLSQKKQSKILVVEDDDSLRLGLKRIFEEEGYSVTVVSDGTQIPYAIQENSFDLILLDIGLPWINGFELAVFIKEHPGLKNVPIVFLSGRDQETDVKQAFLSGADDFIKKPFDIEKMKKTVSTLIELKKEEK
ncbi:MAG: response regulator [Bdellovibrionales bacterium]|nr:response regulator [Bdellovibrionales bacterium]